MWIDITIAKTLMAKLIVNVHLGLSVVPATGVSESVRRRAWGI